MAPIKIHGSPLSTATMRALAALYEKDTPFEFVIVDMKAGDHKKDSFLQLNPFGQVPALEDGDLKLFESRAITQYIAHAYEKKGNQLLCPGTMSMALMSVWMEVEAHQFDTAASKLAWEQFYKPLFGLTTDPAVVEEHEAKLAKILAVYESRLGESKYLACECFSLADLHHLPALHCLLLTPSRKLLDAHPRVSAWASDITARPAWAKVIALQKK